MWVQSLVGEARSHKLCTMAKVTNKTKPEDVACCCLVAHSCPTLCNPMVCSTPGLLVLHCLPEFMLKLMFIESVMPSTHLILCCPLLLWPSLFPSVRVFSKEPALCIRWPKYWRFSFSISPSNEYSRLISCRIDGFDILAVQGTLKSLLQHYSLKASILHAQPCL